MYLAFAATLFVLGRSKTYDFSDKTCTNYILDSYSLLPVGICYQEDFKPASATNTSLYVDYSLIWMCESDGSGGYQAVEYRVGANCDTTYKWMVSTTPTPCNGAAMNQTCQCTPDGDASSDCAIYMRTVYGWELDIYNGFTCDLESGTNYRYVSEMCIDTYGSFDRSYAFRCDGYSYIDGDYYYDSICGSGQPSAAPTTEPTSSPTSSDYTMPPTSDTNYLYCYEYECNGVQGPRAEDAGYTYSVVIAVIAVFVNGLF
jgi:hypothetical protein